MSNLAKNLKDLLGVAAQLKFHVPINNDPAHDYSANFDAQKKFLFGLLSDDTLRTGLVVKAPGSQEISILVPFAGILSFFSISTESKTIYGLRLSILPADALFLRSYLPEGSIVLTDVTFIPVKKQEVKKKILKILQLRKLNASLIQTQISEFLEEVSSIYVRPGEFIGKAESQTMSSDIDFRISFIDALGAYINPIYVLWLLMELFKKKQGTFSPSSHSIVQALYLSSLDFVVNNSGMVENKQNSLLNGPYRILF